MNIRIALLEDLPAITAIYRDGTRDGRSYDYPDLSDEEIQKNREAWFAKHSSRYPVFVAEDKDSGVVGWISLNPFDERPFLAHVGEISIYVNASQRGKGIGKALFEHLFSFAKNNGFQKIIAVCYPNNPALHLKKRMGFEIIGTYTHHVHRGGERYDDLHILEKYL